MIAWLLVACAPRVELAALADDGVQLRVVRSVDPPIDGALRVDAGAVDVRVKGTGANREANTLSELAPGVRLQCELHDRVAAISVFVEAQAPAQDLHATCALGGVNIPVEVGIPSRTRL